MPGLMDLAQPDPQLVTPTSQKRSDLCSRHMSGPPLSPCRNKKRKHIKYRNCQVQEIRNSVILFFCYLASVNASFLMPSTEIVVMDFLVVPGSAVACGCGDEVYFGFLQDIRGHIWLCKQKRCIYLLNLSIKFICLLTRCGSTLGDSQ